MHLSVSCLFVFMPQASHKARELQEEADRLRAEALALKGRARLEDLSIWTMEKVKSTRKDSRTYYYWMATWQEGAAQERCALRAVP